jgi:hypothetical protein
MNSLAHCLIIMMTCLESPAVSDEVDCADCSIFLADLALFKEKHASKCEELDVLRV